MAKKAAVSKTPKKTSTKRAKEEVDDEDALGDGLEESPSKKARIVVGVKIEGTEDAAASKTAMDAAFVDPAWANTAPANDPPPLKSFTAINEHDELDDEKQAMEDLQLLTPKIKKGTTKKRTPARKQKDEDGELDMAEALTATLSKKGCKRVAKKPAVEDDDEDAAVVGAI